MKITIEGEPKEIAALVLEVQGRQEKQQKECYCPVSLSDSELSKS